MSLLVIFMVKNKYLSHKMMKMGIFTIFGVKMGDDVIKWTPKFRQNARLSFINRNNNENHSKRILNDQKSLISKIG